MEEEEASRHDEGGLPRQFVIHGAGGHAVALTAARDDTLTITEADAPLVLVVPDIRPMEYTALIPTSRPAA